jgi:cystathionine gamma-synthase
MHLGGSLSPFAAWSILRGLETLAPRTVMDEANSRRVEAFLADYSKVRSVFWPGSPRHPQHDLAARRMRNLSGLLAFSAKEEGRILARLLAERLRAVSYAGSLSKTKSLLFYIPTEDLLRSSFHREGEEARSLRGWIGDGVFRFSVGLEDPDDIIADLEQALG